LLPLLVQCILSFHNFKVAGLASNRPATRRMYRMQTIVARHTHHTKCTIRRWRWFVEKTGTVRPCLGQVHTVVFSTSLVAKNGLNPPAIGFVVFPMLLLALCAAVSNASTAVAALEIVTGLAAVGAELVVVDVTCTAGHHLETLTRAADRR